MRTRSLLLTAGGLLFCQLAGFSSVAAADDAEELRNQLRAVKQQISAEEKVLGELKADREATKKELANIATEFGELQKRREELAASLRSLGESVSAGEGMLNLLRERRKEEQGHFLASIDKLYRLRAERGVVRYATSAESFGDAAVRSVYLRRVAARNADNIRKLRLEDEELQGEQRSLDELRHEKSAADEELQRVEEQLTQQGNKRKEALGRIEKSESDAKKSLAKLRGSAERVETLLANITGGDEPAEPETETAEDRGKKGPKQPSLIERGYEPAGTGLAKLKGKLAFPVSGTVVHRFGKQRHEEFSDMVFIKGLEVSSAPGSAVKAIAGGKIVLVQDLPTMGKVVVIDHGERYYSLYGRLVSSSAEVGELISSGDEVGQVGERDSRGRNFYLEIRYRGKTVDPAQFFTRLPG